MFMITFSAALIAVAADARDISALRSSRSSLPFEAVVFIATSLTGSSRNK